MDLITSVAVAGDTKEENKVHFGKAGSLKTVTADPKDSLIKLDPLLSLK